MSAPLLFIVLPLILAVILFAFQDRKIAVARIASIISLFLALIAFVQPIGGVLALGPVAIHFQDSLSVLGRGFFLQDGDRFILAIVYLTAAFWFWGSVAAQAPKMFVPVGLAITAVIVGALAVEPFLYAGVLVELAAILTIPMLLTKDHAAGPGILRFFVFQAIALPAILLAGWILGGSQASVSNETQLLQASIILGLGFAFWLAVFPFFPWVPLVMKESHPYTAGFILCMQSLGIVVIIIDYMNGFIWLRDTAALYPILRTVGVVMVVTGGVWAAFQQDARRLFGYVVIIENGLALVAVSMQNGAALSSLYYSFIPHLLALAIFALSLSVMMKDYPDTQYKSLKGALKSKPFAFGAMLVALFSLLGFPLLASFPSRLELFEQLASVSLISMIWLFIGIGGLYLAAARLLSAVFGDTSAQWTVTEKPGELVLFTLGVLALFVLGLFPQIVVSQLSNLMSMIPFLN